MAIITGAGPAFCAGMDLAALRKLADQTPAENLADARRTAGLFRRLWSFPKPLIAAVNGAARRGRLRHGDAVRFHAGVAEAKFGYTEVRVGFMPALISAFLEAAGGRKGGARSAPDRAGPRCGRGAGDWAW